MNPPDWIYNENYLLLCKYIFNKRNVFCLAFEHYWNIFNYFNNDDHYYFILNHDYKSPYNFDLITKVYNYKLNHIKKINITLILIDELQLNFYIKKEFNYKMIHKIDFIELSELNNLSRNNYTETIKILNLSNINLYVLYDDEYKIILTDNYKDAVNLYNKYGSYILFINNYENFNDNKIFHINYKINKEYPNKVISGWNDSINNYAKNYVNMMAIIL